MTLLSAPIFMQSVALILELLHCSNSTLLGIKIANAFRNYLLKLHNNFLIHFAEFVA